MQVRTLLGILQLNFGTPRRFQAEKPSSSQQFLASPFHILSKRIVSLQSTANLQAKMNYSILLTALLGGMLPTTALAQGLNVTAIAAVNNASVLQCWNLEAPATFARGAANYPMGDSTGNFLGVIPPNTHIGQAWAPHVRDTLSLLAGEVVLLTRLTGAVLDLLGWVDEDWRPEQHKHRSVLPSRRHPSSCRHAQRLCYWTYHGLPERGEYGYRAATGCWERGTGA